MPIVMPVLNTFAINTPTIAVLGLPADHCRAPQTAGGPASTRPTPSGIQSRQTTGAMAKLVPAPKASAKTSRTMRGTGGGDANNARPREMPEANSAR